MFNSQILDVLVGLVFIYCLISVICTAIKEGLESFLKTRAAYLENGIRELLHDRSGKGLAKDLFEHPLIYSLFSGDYESSEKSGKPGLLAKGGNLPSYIPSANFAKALMDLAAHGPDTNAAELTSSARAIDLGTIRANAIRLNNRQVQRVLLSAIDHAQGSVEQAQKNLEQWYDSAMERVAGSYRRATQKIIFVISLSVTIALNVNTLAIVHYLYVNDVARSMLSAEAQQSAGTTDLTYQAAREKLDGFTLPIGWSDDVIAELNKKSTFALAYQLILGWLMTTFAATLGAPFWFDMLNKIMVVRSTIKPKEKTQPTLTSEQTIVAQTNAVTSPTDPQMALPQNKSIDAFDADTHLDGCDGNHAGIETPDSELPKAQGGVAS